MEAEDIGAWLWLNEGYGVARWASSTNRGERVWVRERVSMDALMRRTQEALHKLMLVSLKQHALALELRQLAVRSERL
jgi:hypothetical protein